ncbi:MAG: hypothetical protein K2W95_20990 [Candidatus Obscuribacterales bacterium]|nr:hypothetical protein [Candidatus Obscuribacterales bacterium]
MTKNAVLWIRDGVLVHRMHLNAVAFAATVWYAGRMLQRDEIQFEDLINFAFEKSGISCADKLKLWNEERSGKVSDVEDATALYNLLAIRAGEQCNFFPGASQLLADICKAGHSNFITSAVEQEVLDAWIASRQGMEVRGYLTEILGRRPNFNKGRDHFDFVCRKLGHQRLFMIADAAAEIRASHENATDFNIATIGFANEITEADVLDAFELVQSTLSTLNSEPEDRFPKRTQEKDWLAQLPTELCAQRILLPERRELEDSLHRAGADKVVGGTRNSIMSTLRTGLQDAGLQLDPAS